MFRNICCWIVASYLWTFDVFGDVIPHICVEHLSEMILILLFTRLLCTKDRIDLPARSRKGTTGFRTTHMSMYRKETCVLRLLLSI